MDYTGFIKNYYRIAISKLNRFSHYRGTFVSLSYPMNVPMDQVHVVEPNFDALPFFEVNINADVKYFENYIDYVIKNTPDLAIIFLGKNILRTLFENAILNEQDENKAVEKINLIIDLGIEVLKTSGVIS